MERTFDSSEYWENRYAKNGTSGVGSYGNLCEFKAKIINNFIDEHKPKSLLDLGCGDGNQLERLNIANIDYIGVDPSSTIIDKLKKKYKDDDKKQFLLLDEKINDKVDLTLSCDVLYHLVDLDLWLKHIDSLFSLSIKHVIIYASNFDKDWGNHCKSRKFTDIVEQKYPEWKLLSFIENEYSLSKGCANGNVSMADFYIFEKQ